MIKLNIDVQFFSEKIAKRIAEVVGEHSAAAQALAELNRRRQNNEDVFLYVDKRSHNSTFIVGPILPGFDVFQDEDDEDR